MIVIRPYIEKISKFNWLPWVQVDQASFPAEIYKFETYISKRKAKKVLATLLAMATDDYWIEMQMGILDIRPIQIHGESSR